MLTVHTEYIKLKTNVLKEKALSADFTVSIRKPSSINAEQQQNLVGHRMMAKKLLVKMTIIGGKTIMRDGEITYCPIIRYFNI